MKFIKKEYDASGEEVFTEIHCMPEEAVEYINNEFRTNPEAASVDELLQADGKMVVSVRDRRKKIIIQLKQL